MKDNGMKVAKLLKQVNKHQSKTYKIIAIISKQVLELSNGTFYKWGLLWLNACCSDIASEVGCSKQQVHKVLVMLRREGYIRYEFVSNFGYVMRNTHDNKCISFTPLGSAVILEHFRDKNRGGGKTVDAITTEEVNRNDYLNKLTSDEVVFRKNNDSKGALGFNLLLKNGIVVPIERRTFCFIVKLCSIIARGLSTEIAIQRLREYINWLILRLKAVKYDDVFNFKNVFKFYFIARKRWQAEEREARLLEEHAERRLLDDRKREYQYNPFSAVSNAVGCIADGLLQRFSMSRMLQ